MNSERISGNFSRNNWAACVPTLSTATQAVQQLLEKVQRDGRKVLPEPSLADRY